MYFFLFKRVLVVGSLLGVVVVAGSASAAVQVTVGNHPSCDHASIRDAIGQPDALLDLTILVQGRAADGSGGQQGIHDADLTIIGPRTVEIIGDDGSNPLSTCTGFNASRRPEIRGLATSDAGYKVVVRDGGTLSLKAIDVRDTFAGGVQLTQSDLLAVEVDFVGNVTPAGVSGAAIQVDSGVVSLKDVNLLGNFSPAAGGAIFCTSTENARILAQDANFGASRTGSGNRAGFDGGAVALHRNCAFESTGGVVFEGNFAGRDGGAIAAAADDGNRVDLRSDITFGLTHGNVASRNGGAIALGAQARLSAEDTLSLFKRNSAGEAGGALHVAEAAAAVLLGCEHFVGNEAGTGGAVHSHGVVTVRNLENTLLCDSTLDLPPNRYQTMFESNLATEGAGGAVFADGKGAVVRIEQAAMIGNDSTIPGDFSIPLGSVAFVTNGAALHIENSMLWANGHESTSLFNSPPTLLQATETGSRIDLGLTTVVENIGAHSLMVNQGATARLFGLIEFNNDMLAPSSGGSAILSVCSTVDADLDPEFIPSPGTHRGLFRLVPDSPMRGFCPVSDAPFPLHFDIDLDNVPRSQRPFGDRVHVDAGAFNINSALSVATRCTTEDNQFGLAMSMSGDGSSFNVTGNGPHLPLTTNNGLAFLPDDGGGGWTDVVVKENNGDREDFVIGDVSCSTAVLSVSVSGPGVVTSNPSGIDCPADCQESFAPGESVSLTASAGAGAAFTGWSKASCGLDAVCTVTLQDALTVVANFESPDSIFNDEFEQ